MYVNKVQQSPNFGMALRIKPQAVKALKQLSRKEVESLQKVGEMLKNTKYYNLEIGEGGTRIITAPYGNNYKGGCFECIQPQDEYLELKACLINKESLSSTKPEGKYKIMVKFPDQNAAASAYKDISETTSFVEKDAKIVKYLDAREVERAEEAKVAQDERMAVESMVDELFAKYPSI